MELLKGETLDETVERGVLTAEDFKEVVYQTMEGLIAAQANNVIHRDIKPTNIMLIWQASGKFQLKILDFGLAKFSKAPSVQTMDQDDAVMGSIFFMAPEQFERAELDARTDLYQMGCVYYNALTGQYPFNGETAPPGDECPSPAQDRPSGTASPRSSARRRAMGHVADQPGYFEPPLGCQGSIEVFSEGHRHGLPRFPPRLPFRWRLLRRPDRPPSRSPFRAVTPRLLRT